MRDEHCVGLLRWALPRVGLRWKGLRRVRRQVCRRIDRRMTALGLERITDYRAHLEAEPGEWRVLERLCRVTISRRWRDRAVFEALGSSVLPEGLEGVEPWPAATHVFRRRG